MRASAPEARELRHRPRGLPGHLASLLDPMMVPTARAALERRPGERLHRLGRAAVERGRERRHPRQPRMRALSVRPGGRLSWRDVPAPPAPGPGEAVVHPIAVATCDMDRPLALGRTPFPLPLHLGHECVAEVLAVGDGVSTVQVGQRVVVPFQISCGTCPPCRHGLTGNCAQVPPLSMYGFGVVGGHWGGALSDQLLVPFADAMLVALPDGTDPVAAASVADTVCDGFRHVAPHLPALLERDADTEVLILAGLRRAPVYSPSVPLYAGLVAQALGARHISLVDSRAHVRRLADRLGLCPLSPDQLRHHPTASLVIDISADPRGLAAALRATAPDGVCTSAAGLYRGARIPTGLMFARNVSLHVGRTHARAHMPNVLELMQEHLLHPETVATVVDRFDDAPRVLHEHYVGDAIKTIVTT